MRHGLSSFDPEPLADAREAGFDYAEVPVSELIKPGEPQGAFEDAAARFLAAGLPIESCNMFLAPGLRCTGPDADHARIADYAAGVFARLRAAGAATMVFGSGWARAVPDGWPRERADEQFTSLLASLGPLAEAEGVSLVLEPLARVECNFLNTPEEGARFARESGSAAVGVLADSFHWLRNGEGPETIAAARDRFRHAHVSTVPGRLMPGREPCDLGPFFGALAAIGYDGRVTVEAKAEPPEGRAEKLRLALAAMRGWEAR